MKIAIISDTHGHIEDRVLEVFRGAEAIFHAGDIGSFRVIEVLSSIAPVYGVSGNMDGMEIRRRFPAKDLVEFGGHSFYLIHEPRLLDIDPGAAGVDSVIFGHTHSPLIERRDGVLFINPGSASLPRYKRPPTVICCEMEGGRLVPSLITL